MDAKGSSASFVDRAKLKRKQTLVKVFNGKQALRPSKRAKTPGANSTCCISPMVVVENYNNFKKSGIPDRVMYFRNGDWTDFPSGTALLLKHAFVGGKTVSEFSVGCFSYLVDFLRMLLIDMSNASQRSIAWIDVNGKCFFPRVVCEDKRQLSSPSLDVGIAVRNNGPDGLKDDKCKVITEREAKEKSVESEDSSEHGSSNTSQSDNSDVSDECQSSARVSGVSFRACLANGAFGELEMRHNLIKLEEGDGDFVMVRDRFVAGLSTLANFTSVVAVYRNSLTTIVGQSRLHTFQRHVQDIMRKNGGNPNVRYAWHGTSKEGVRGIILHGFGQPRIPKHGAVLGNGVYLAPGKFSHVSVRYSDVDENGEQHMVLCKVLMGNIELVRPGSQQFHPSSEEYDTGVDDLDNPKRYIVWSTHMNTHILPEYVVTFKVSPDFHRYWSIMKPKGGINGQGGPISSLQDVQMQRGPKYSLQDGHVASSGSLFKKDGDTQSCPPLVKESEHSGPALLNESEHKMQGHARMPTSAFMSFPRLFTVMENFLSSSSIRVMKQHYAYYKGNKISRQELIRRLRLVAGDRLLIQALKMFQGQVLPSMKGKISHVPAN